MRKLKIAFFVEAFPQVSETFILDQVIACLDRGYDVQVFTTTNQPKTCDHAEVQARSLADLVVRPSPGTRLASTLRATAKLMGLARIYGPTNIRQCLSFVANHAPQKFDVIHAHFAPAGRRVALLKKAGYLEGKLITTFHGFDLHTIPRRLPLSYYAPVFGESEWLTCGSNFMLDLARWMGAPQHKLKLIPMGVDLTEFSQRPPLGPPVNDTLQLLSIGRLVEFKGHALALAALARLAPDFRFHYTIVGNGPLLTQLRGQINDLRLTNSVTLAGSLPRDAVRAHLRATHALLHSSIQASNGSVESQGVVLAEAAAIGIPIIATRSGGVPDTVRHHFNGILVEPNNPEALAQAITEFAASASKWRTWGENSRAIAEQSFNAELNQHHFFDIYEND